MKNVCYEYLSSSSHFAILLTEVAVNCGWVGHASKANTRLIHYKDIEQTPVLYNYICSLLR